jgi:hypothetical protein
MVMVSNFKLVESIKKNIFPCCNEKLKVIGSRKRKYISLYQPATTSGYQYRCFLQTEVLTNYILLQGIKNTFRNHA